MDSEQELDAKRYRLLRDYLLLNGIVRHVKLLPRESEPFVIGNMFYGPTFGDAVDTLKAEGDGSIPER